MNDGKITRQAALTALSACGIRAGDTILVHSDLAALGLAEGGTGNLLPFYDGVFREVLGEEGTLVVPAFFYEYARWQTPYDRCRSPVSKELGIFSQFIVKQKLCIRSINPVAALGAIGKKAGWICDGGTGSAYGIDSPWDRFAKSDSKMLFLGADLRAMTFVHYVEYLVGVPHLYSKVYPMPILENGRELSARVVAQVRYLDFGIQYSSDRFTGLFEEAGLVKKAVLGRGFIRCVDTEAVFHFLKEKLKADAYFLLTKTPDFVQGKIPMDGPAGAARP
jgi:aminoglycoside 3-N-acetyltransferase